MVYLSKIITDLCSTVDTKYTTTAIFEWFQNYELPFGNILNGKMNLTSEHTDTKLVNFPFFVFVISVGANRNVILYYV